MIKNSFVCAVVLAGAVLLASVRGQEPDAGAVILVIQGKVEVAQPGGDWKPARLNEALKPGDRVRTGDRARADVRLSNRTVLPVGSNTIIQIEVQRPDDSHPALFLQRGSIYFQSRQRGEEMRFRTRLASGAIRGTEFHLASAEDGRTVLTLFDGEVELGNEHGRLEIRSDEQAVVEPGAAPKMETARLDAASVIQWALYYPAVLHLADLPADALEALPGASVRAYEEGDLVAALGSYPEGRSPASIAERVYLAALLLSVGQVDETDRLLREFASSGAGESRQQELARALRTLIAAVKQEPHPDESAGPSTATAWMAQSYFAQSRFDLDAALNAARRATELAPGFGFAWARLAELEFSFGRIDAARAAVRESLRHAPRNAQAVALQGFLGAGASQFAVALEAFNRAIALDGALGSAWLGRGLVRIRQGDAEAGLQDLQMAAALEPQRSLFRSYLAKAFHHQDEFDRAVNELEIARRLDPNDPTPLLYSALLRQQQNRINEAIRDLERSQELNENRGVFRSRLLLDQDSAVRSANLAGIYQDAGMFDVSRREAIRAVNSDYANYSAHLFLADSYNAFRDARLINLRYETPAVTEYLVANLLAPVNAGVLSPHISQNEYAALFARDRLGLSSSTEYLSGGDWFQGASQFGNFGRTSYALETMYRFQNGERVNHEFEQLQFSAKVRQQLTLKDSVYLQAIYYEAESGDLHPYYDPGTGPRRRFRAEEKQEPILFAGYHRRWNPGNDTLFLFGYANDAAEARDPDHRALVIGKNAAGTVTGATTFADPLRYRNELELYSAELQHVWQRPGHAIVAGSRYQSGEVQARSQWEPGTLTADVERWTVYGYYTWRIIDPLAITAGLAYDTLTSPVNYRLPPLSAGERSQERLSPKAGFVWTPFKDAAIRAQYFRALGGVSYDQSFRLEPTQVGGFNQAYRSVIPESVAGSLAGATFEGWAAGFDQRFPSGTYLGIEVQGLESEARRVRGVAESVFVFPSVTTTPGGARQEFDYSERSASVTVNQLLGAAWSLGAQYRWTDSELDARYPGLPPVSPLVAPRSLEATLHQATLFAGFNHPTGLFHQAEAVWYQQSNRGYNGDIPGDDFWHFNAFAGYRFFDRAAELRLGVLNIFDQDYRLNPLNFYSEPRRDRTFLAGFRFFF